MSTIRPEVQSFTQAVEKLLSYDTARSPLSDDEMEKVADCLARVEEALQAGQI